MSICEPKLSNKVYPMPEYVSYDTMTPSIPNGMDMDMDMEDNSSSNSNNNGRDLYEIYSIWDNPNNPKSGWSKYCCFTICIRS